MHSTQSTSWSLTGLSHVGFPGKRYKFFPLLPRSCSLLFTIYSVLWVGLQSAMLHCQSQRAPYQWAQITVERRVHIYCRNRGSVLNRGHTPVSVNKDDSSWDLLPQSLVQSPLMLYGGGIASSQIC